MIFRKIPKHERYGISRIGDVINFHTGRILKPYTNKGYYYICLSSLGEVFKYRVNRLVAICYIPNPHNKPLVHHKDHDRLNNAVENLCWATHKENSAFAFDANRRRPYVGEYNPRAIVNEKTVKKIRKQSTRYTAAELSRMHNINYSTMQGIVSGRNWSHLE